MHALYLHRTAVRSLSAFFLPVLVGGVLVALPERTIAEPLDRGAVPAAGSVIEQKLGEEVRFVDLSNWQNVERYQSLLGGDLLRTNATGQLAILFADRTQVRLGRNSVLQVKQMAPAGDTRLSLASGTMWARAERGGQGLAVETPAATAAIRGTDWSLTVQGDKTSLIVMEGLVELANEHGSVEVSQGEAAFATPGQAPQKLIIVTPDDRQQMLFYLTLRDGFTFMPATPLPEKRLREQETRVLTLPPAQRSAEDWLTLAEASLSLQGRQEARAALAEARKRPLSRAGKARAAYLEALMAGTEKRYADAARLLAEAKPALDPARRAIAAYAEYYARSLADPTLALTPPTVVSDPYSAVMKAYTAGFLEDVPAAIAIIKDAEAQFPKESSLPAVRALLAQMNNDRVQMREAIDQALALDPDDSIALLARSRYYLEFEGNLKASLADLNRAVEISPASSTIWNNLGLVEDARGNARAAEAALKRSIELDPESAIGYANLAILYLDQARMKEAKRQIDQALAADPAFSLALLARGRYYLQTGEIAKATDDLLASSVANPGYSQAQLMLAAAHYESGAQVPAEQAIDNADRLDKNDPVISSIRTAVAIDEYDAEGAIRNAQEFLRRSQARGGHYASLGANQSAGSTLNSAFRLQGLDAWGQYYGDAVFDPFSGSAYIDQSVRGGADPLANAFFYGGNVITNTQNSSSFSSFLQGLMFEPHMLAGRSRSTNLFRRPFFEGEIGVGTTLNPGVEGLASDVTIQGYANEPVPISGYLNLQYSKSPDYTRSVIFGPDAFDMDSESGVTSATGYLTSTITPNDRVVAYINHNKSTFNFDVPFPLIPLSSFNYGLSTNFTTAGLGWSHTAGYRNVINTALFYSVTDVGIGQNLYPFPILLDSLIEMKQKAYVAAVNHTLGDDDLTWRYGVEGGITNRSTTESYWALGVPIPPVETKENSFYGRFYVDVLHDIAPDLKAEYGLFGTLLTGDDELRRLEPRAGLAWTPSEGHWLRAGYIRQGTDMSTPTLAPVGILGLQANEFGVGAEGYSDTLAVKWDAEWSDRLFTTVDYQHQMFRDLSISDIILLKNFNSNEAVADRFSVTANLAIGYGFGLSTTYALAFSEDKDPTSFGYGRDLPFLPRHAGQVALTYVNDANVKATLAANYVGERHGDQTARVLDGYWTLDAQLTWEPFGKNMVFEASAYNLLDEDFMVSPDLNGWGRVFKGMVKVRF